MTERQSPYEILATKLYAPPTRPEFVPRPRLLERLNDGRRRKLTLISAPAGFGKTTLVSDWFHQSETPAAWLSLDQRERDPIRFLSYLAAALQTVAADLGEEGLELLSSPRPLSAESLLTALINEIATIADHFLLILDDYHTVDSRAVDEALTFLLDHLPPQMHLVITTREDPQIPLARLRVRGQLTELRAVDLRFTPGEAAAFLNQVMGLELSAKQVTALESRTEGWIAGLQLAALSMQGREDIAGFIQAFAGDNRYIVDYLVEEVLQRQPEHVRNFLLQTSILERLHGSLCDAVTGQKDGSVQLEALERGNLFVISLDEKRQWFRYHHLFADVLRAHAMREQPDQLSPWHLRASEWYDSHGLPGDAFRHALAAEEFERAASIAELAWPAMDGQFQSSTWLGWVKELPDDLVRVRPVLSVAYAWALLSDGELEAGEARLRDAEVWLEMSTERSERTEKPTGEMVVVDEEQFRFLPGSIYTARAYYAQGLGDIPGSVVHAQRALDFLPEEDYLRRGPAAALLGLSQWGNGDLDAAHKVLAEGMVNFQKAGNLNFALSVTYALADIRLTQGRLRDAIRTYERALQLATAQGESTPVGTADLYLGLGDLYREMGDLEAAIQYLKKSEELGPQAGLPDWPCRFHLAQAGLKQAQGDLDGALDRLDEAERLYVRGPVPDIRPIAAWKVRIWIKQGRLSEARDWGRERGLFVDDECNFLGEFEHIVLARLLLAEAKNHGADRMIEAMGLLERLLNAAEESGRMGSVLVILVLQSLAHEAQGETSQALTTLTRALELAEPEGYVQLFVDEGASLEQLLGRIEPAHERLKTYLDKLCNAFGEQSHPHSSSPEEPEAKHIKSTASRGVSDPSGSLQSLVEPLSQRELEILQLIAEGLSNAEIGKRLFLALSTVKGHNRNIFGKLGVRRRTEAVARARELGLV